MSAPQTNIEKQEKRHKPALFGMGAAVLWSIVLLVGLIVWITYNGNEPDGADAQVNGMTGEVETTAE